MRTKARSTRLASILLPAFLYLGCTGEGITGPTHAGEGAGQEAADDRGHVTERGPAPAETAEDQCIYWGEEMFCPDSVGYSDDRDVE